MKRMSLRMRETTSTAIPMTQMMRTCKTTLVTIVTETTLNKLLETMISASSTKKRQREPIQTMKMSTVAKTKLMRTRW